MIKALIKKYEQGGWLPKWPSLTYTNIMIGTHADSIIAESCVKGLMDFDVEKAYEAMYKNAMVPPDGENDRRWIDTKAWTSYEARAGISWYKTIGYVPADKIDDSVSRTLEFAYNDYCIAQVAKILGKMDDYEMFMKRSRYYKNHWNAEEGFLLPRDANGLWSPPDDYCAFAESDRWPYLFCVLQDVNGLVELMGGDEAFEKKLDEDFEQGHYAHYNEPSHHYAYLYNYCSRPWKTQSKVREVMKQFYQNRPDGLCGNDDAGQMSAWYLLSSLGFYPVNPASGEYDIGSPIWDEAVIKLDKPYKKGEFKIICKNQSPENKYVQSISLNGRPLRRPFIKHSDIVAGGKLVFVMGPEPGNNWINGK